MALECLLLTGDSALLSTIRAKCSEQGIELLVRKDAASAIEFSERRHLDGFVIDVPQGKEALRSIPANPANKQSVMLAIVNGRTSVSEAFELGANFVLAKPIQDGRICAVLDTAVPKMEREHRRYFRHSIDLPIELQLYTGQSFRAKMRNISEAGFAIRTSGTLPESVLIVQIDLPSIDPETITGSAVVVWASASVAGLRFPHL